MRSRILGTGSYVPDRVLTNNDLEQMVATSDSWIIERTGIRERRLVSPGQACSDLAREAGERALNRAGVSASDLDMILIATCTGDAPLPSTACLVQHRLGATKAAACDISAACCGFIYALTIADSYIKAGFRYVLVIGSEVMSVITDWTDRNTCVLWGDGAGAVVLGHSAGDEGVLSLHLHADGQMSDLIEVPGGGSSCPASEKMLTEKLQYIKMKGNETFKIAVKTMEEAVREALSANKLNVNDVDAFVPHQANVRILKAVSQRLGLPFSKTVVNLDRYGNTSAASIPLALDEAVQDGRIQAGPQGVICCLWCGVNLGFWSADGGKGTWKL